MIWYIGVTIFIIFFIAWIGFTIRWLLSDDKMEAIMPVLYTCIGFNIGNLIVQLSRLSL